MRLRLRPRPGGPRGRLAAILLGLAAVACGGASKRPPAAAAATQPSQPAEDDAEGDTCIDWDPSGECIEWATPDGVPEGD